VAVISFVKTSGKGGELLDVINDFLLWYAKDKTQLKYRQLYLQKEWGEEGTKGYQHVELSNGTRRRLNQEELSNSTLLPKGSRVFKASDITSQEPGKTSFEYELQGRKFMPAKGKRHWATDFNGMERLRHAERLFPVGNTLSYVRYLDEMPIRPLTNIWTDTGIAGYGDPKLFAVQTNTKVIERCILMATDPGDLVFDPTCGSGTTAWCAEKWGRRWITCDTSRVALAIARQRLMTAKFDYYELKDPERGPAGGFIYETVPHITLESIAKNTEIDEIAAKYQPQIDEALKELNRSLGKDWKEWEVPREAEEGWPQEAKEAHERFWSLRRKKRQEIDESIKCNAPQETLYDRPKVKRGVVRVSGPFTVEAIPVPFVEDPTQAPVPQFEEEEAQARISDRGGDYLTTMINLLKAQGGVLFPGGKKMELQSLRPLNIGMLHAEAETSQNGKSLRVAISFGPQYGPITATQANEAIQTAKLNAYQVLILAGFSIEAEAQAFVQKARELVPGLSIHFANIAPDVLVGDLLKTTRASQIFTVFGQPDVGVEQQKDGTYVVELRGVDIYDPLAGEVHSTRGEDVAAWFLDTDYDGMTFHICQAFFPGDPKAWGKLQRALKAQIDPEAFEQMRTTRSFPFKPGEHNRIAVKVIDFRGNEVMRVVNL